MYMPGGLTFPDVDIICSVGRNWMDFLLRVNPPVAACKICTGGVQTINIIVIPCPWPRLPQAPRKGGVSTDLQQKVY